MINLTALALALGGGLLSALASAQQNQPAPGDIQLYSQPQQIAEPPAMPPPRPYPDHAEPRPEQATDSPGDNSPDWSSPVGSGPVQNDQGIRYISGGIGDDERAELEALSSQFNLRLLFAMQGSGNYLADVQVRILDSRGATVLSAISTGPWFLAQLPPGIYTVEVSTPDQSQRQTLQIDQRQSRLNFYWR
jgi:hypothetical protein